MYIRPAEEQPPENKHGESDDEDAKRDECFLCHGVPSLRQPVSGLSIAFADRFSCGVNSGRSVF